MRVAITHAYSWPEVRRGAERITVETARALAGRGHHVTHLTAARRWGAARVDGVLTIRLPRVRRTPARHERDFGLELVPLLRAGRFDVVHGLGVRDAAAGVRAGRRTLFENMGVPARAWWDRQPECDAHELLVREADVYGCMSQYALDFLDRDYGRAGALVPGGVNLAEFEPSPAREPRPTLLFSGAIEEPRKGLAFLLRALPLIAEKEPDIRLWVSGPGDADALLRSAPAAARRHVELLGLGEARDQAGRYGRAWVTALPSIDEVFGLVYLESLACGTPVVATTSAAGPERATPGVGFTCEPGDARGLADACLAALELSHEPGIVDRCRDAAAPYDWATAIAPRLEALYEA